MEIGHWKMSFMWRRQSKRRASHIRPIASLQLRSSIAWTRLANTWCYTRRPSLRKSNHCVWRSAFLSCGQTSESQTRPEAAENHCWNFDAGAEEAITATLLVRVLSTRFSLVWTDSSATTERYKQDLLAAWIASVLCGQGKKSQTIRIRH